jgi:hypothetical protein
MENIKEIPGFPGYFASFAGNIISTKKGKPKILKGRPLKTTRNGVKSKRHLPYLVVALYVNGKPAQQYIHILIAKLFKSNPNNLSQVNHLDGDVQNNYSENLEWSSASSNVKYSIEKFGRNERRGKDNNKTKLSQEQADKIRELYTTVKSQRKLAKMFNVVQNTIRLILKNRTHMQKETIRFHQGDVIGCSIAEVPKGAIKIENRPIAYGEHSGHVHVLTGDVQMFEVEGRLIAAVGSDGARLQHIHESNFTAKCWTSPDELKKADHNSHLLPGGVYEFWIQNAYNPYTKLMEQVID